MVTYGWTIDQALDVTLPQANMLFREMAKAPSPAAVIGAFLASRVEDKTEQAIGQLAEHAAVEEVAGGSDEFFAKIGIETGG